MSLNDPRWGNRGNNEERGGKRGDEQGPPDLDEIWREFNQRLSGLFGRNREGGGPSGPRGNLPKRPDMPPFKQLGNGLLLLAILILVVWLCSGFYIVNTNERGVVLRMGRYNEVTQPGLHWRMPWPIETHETVDMTSVRTVSVDSQGGDRSLMITDDLNIVSVPFAVQYLLDDKRDDTATEIGPRNYIFKNFMLSEETFVRQIAEAAMREVVGRNKMDFVLYEGKAQIAQDAQNLIQKMLNHYESGISVQIVTMENVQPPEKVRDAFEDATKATQDEERQKNEGESYANDVVPAAQGNAARLRADAEAYSAKVVALAQGEADRFKKVYSEFKLAPQVTRERMYLDAVEQVLSRTRKVMIDNKGSNNIMYLPLDKLIQQQGVSTITPNTNNNGGAGGLLQPEAAPSAAPKGSPRDREFLRSRDRGDL